MTNDQGNPDFDFAQLMKALNDLDPAQLMKVLEIYRPGNVAGGRQNQETIQITQVINIIMPGTTIGNLSTGDSFAQMPLPGNEMDITLLASQLAIIRAAMKQQSGDAPSAAQDDEIGHVARAEIAAERGDAGGALAHLKQAGAWTLKVAQETGAEIVALFLAHLARG